MKKLTTEHLLFAHRIGATLRLSNTANIVDGYLGKPGYVYRDSRWHEWNSDTSTVFDTISDPKNREQIDFSPLYDWIDHDGGECPVRNSDVVIVREQGSQLEYAAQAVSVDWSKNLKFKLSGASADWPEQRSDAIGQNGNDGEHYDIPTPEYDPRDVAFKPKKSKYHREIAPGVWVDVYDVLKAWKVENPALQHLIKKALQPGERGHKTLDQDMKDIVASAIRAQELASKPED